MELAAGLWPRLEMFVRVGRTSGGAAQQGGWQSIGLPVDRTRSCGVGANGCDHIGLGSDRLQDLDFSETHYGFGKTYNEQILHFEGYQSGMGHFFHTKLNIHEALCHDNHWVSS